MPSHLPATVPSHNRAIKQGVSFLPENMTLYHAMWKLVARRRQQGDRNANFSRVFVELAERGLGIMHKEKGTK